MDVYEDSQFQAELGASIFVEVNRILVEAVKVFNLTTSSFGAQARSKSSAPSLGIWNGEEFVVTLSPSGPSWWDTARLLWKYGLSPVRTRSLMKATVGKFLKLYDAPWFPFDSLESFARSVELRDTIGQSGATLLAGNGVGLPFARDIVQASTRVNYASNLDFIHGLETMVCMATDGAMAVDGGNWQIFQHMLNESGAKVLLGTTVSGISKNSSGNYNIKVEPHASDSEAAELAVEADAVIIAAPFHQTGIEVDIDCFRFFRKPENVTYVALHVTLFTTPLQLSRAAFNIPEGQEVPLTVLTTLPASEQPREGSDSAGSPGFYSISTLDIVENPKTGAQEYLYKIFSPMELDKQWILDHLETGSGKTRSEKDEISWIHRKLWYSYPQESPRDEFDDIELGDGLWYTGGMETFISTMETNALMGRNVAALVIEALQEKDLEWPNIDFRQILCTADRA